MKSSPSAFVLLAFAMASASFPARVAGAPDSAQADAARDGLAIQGARNRLNASLGSKRFYTRDWDLSGLPAYVPARPVSGTIRMWGNDAVTNGMLGQYWTAGFRKFQPGVKLDFDLKSSALALPGLIAGGADIGIGRHAMFMELLGYERLYNCDPLEVTALNGAYDALGWSPGYVIVVNRGNPIERIRVGQLDGIFGAERNGGWIGTTWHPEFARGPEKNLRTWGQLGLPGEWRDRPIHPYAMNLEYNPTVDFSRLVLQGSGKWNEALRQYSQYARPDGTLALGAQELVKDIAHDPDGIGISCVSYLIPGTKALALAATDSGPYIAPTLSSFQDRSYFLHGACYFYLKRERGRPLDPAVREFVRYVLSREGQAAVVRDGKFLPMPADAVREELRKLE